MPVEIIVKSEDETPAEVEQQEHKPIVAMQQDEEQEQSNETATELDTKSSETELRPSEVVNEQEQNTDEAEISINVDTAAVATQPAEENTQESVIIEKPSESQTDEDSQPEEDSSIARTVTPGSEDSVTPESEEEESASEETETDNTANESTELGVTAGMSGRPRPAGIEAPEVPETDEVEEPHETIADIRKRFQSGQAFTPESAKHNPRKSVTNESLKQDLGSVSVKDKAKTFKFAPTPTKAAADDGESMKERMDEVSNRKTTSAMKDYWHTVEEINSTVVTRRDF